MEVGRLAQQRGRGGETVAAILPRQLLISSRAAWGLMAAAMAAYASLEFWLTRGTTMFLDEYGLFLADRGLRPSVLFAPFNEHLILVRRLLYAIGFQVLGASGAFLMAKFVEAAGVIVLAGLVFVFLKQRIGPAAALAPSVLLLFFGSAWEINFSISGIDNVFALAGGIGALMAIERASRRADVAACLLLAVSLLSYTTGAAFAIGAFCLLAVRRELRARGWIVFVPVALYAAWLVWVRVVYLPGHPGAQSVALSNVLLIPSMIAQQGAATAGALAGVNYNFNTSDPFSVFSTSTAYGAPLAAAGGALLIWRLRRGASPLLWALAATLIAYWVELAIGTGMGRNPTTVRYVYAAGVITILIAGEAINRPVRSTHVLAILYAVTVFSLVGNVTRLRDGMQIYRTFGTTMRAQLSAIEIAAPAERPSFTTRLGFPPLGIGVAGPYLQAVKRNGSPAYSSRELARQSEGQRAVADGVLVSALRLHLSTPNPGQSASSCRRFGLGLGGPAAVVLGPPGAELRSSTTAQVAVSRYGSSDTIPVGTLRPGSAADLRIPRDRAALPWRVMIGTTPARITVCKL